MSKDLTEALHALTISAQGQTSRVDSALPAARPTSAIPARSGSSGPVTGPGSGISGPLTETSYSARTYWADVTITSTDGIFTMVEKPIKSISFADALSNSLVMNYAQPS